MGLITIEVEIKLRGKNINRYEKLGYKIPRKVNKQGKLVVSQDDAITIHTNDLSDGSGIKVSTKCDCCGKITTNSWCDYKKQVKENEKTYCRECTNKLFVSEKMKNTKLLKGTSFKEWCINNNYIDILDRWDYKMNNCLPEEINSGTTEKYWFKCPKHTHKSELKDIRSFTRGQLGSMDCKQCNSFAQWGIDNLGDDFLEKYWDYNKNTIDPYQISHGSTIKVWLKCQECGNLKFIEPNRFTMHGMACSKCSDGISYPNKLMYSILQQLKIGFETEKYFDWCQYFYKGKLRKGIYDFYFELNENKYIIEMDGRFHNNDNSLSGQNAEESKFIDNEKNKMALEHGIKIIRINSDKSELEYIKNNILNSELNCILDLNNVNWNNCNVFIHTSLIKSVCSLWNDGMNIKEISKILKLNRNTITRYLKTGHKQNWCKYTVDQAYVKKRKKIYCIELNELFYSVADACNKFNIKGGNIKAAIDRKGTCGGYHWMYYEDYLDNQKISA